MPLNSEQAPGAYERTRVYSLRLTAEEFASVELIRHYHIVAGAHPLHFRFSDAVRYAISVTAGIIRSADDAPA